MATVAVTIGGRSYRVACGPGEERHLQDLVRHVDKTMASLRKGFGEVGDSRLVVMTAITVADELFETKRRLAEAEEQLATVGATNSDGEARSAELAEAVAESLDAASERIERIVQELNHAEKL